MDTFKAGDRVELQCGLVVTVERVECRTGRFRGERVRNVDLHFTHPRGFKAVVRVSGAPTHPFIKCRVEDV